MAKLRIKRKGYIRRSYVKDVIPGKGVKLKRIPSTRVKPTTYLAKDRGKPGRTPKSKRWAKFEGNLSGWRKDLPESKRHECIMKTVRRDGVNSTKRKLIQLANVTTDRETKIKARKDFEWLRRKYPPKSLRW